MIDKILILTAFPPNQKTAGQDYTRRLILDFVNRGIQVDLIYAEYPEHNLDIPDSVNVLKTIHPSLSKCVRKINFHPFYTKRFDKSICKYVQQIADGYSMIYFDFSQMHIYSNYIKHPFKVVVCHDVICQKFSRNTCKLNVLWVKNSERELLKSANYVFTFCDKDSKLLDKIYSIKSYRANNYLKYIHFRYDMNKNISNAYCFYGAWNRKENTEALEYFIDNIYPSLTKKRSYIVIGGGMSESLKRRIESLDGFRYIGFVDDPIYEISKCQALIAPLHYGAGIKIKVLDALTAGTSVIGTDVAFEGIEDNVSNPMFYYVNEKQDYLDVLDNWKEQSVDYKQKASNEFCDRYNTNHFPDIIERLYRL